MSLYAYLLVVLDGFSVSRCFLSHNILILPSAAVAHQQQQQQQHINVADGVFILYRGEDTDAEPIGTAFAISDKLLLTACHNVVVKSRDEKADSVVLDLKITTIVRRLSDGKISAESPTRFVTVHTYNIPVDWASLKLHDGAPALPFAIPLATSKSDIPTPATLEKIHIYHCPL